MWEWINLRKLKEQRNCLCLLLFQLPNTNLLCISLSVSSRNENKQRWSNLARSILQTHVIKFHFPHTKQSKILKTEEEDKEKRKKEWKKGQVLPANPPVRGTLYLLKENRKRSGCRSSQAVPVRPSCEGRLEGM